MPLTHSEENYLKAIWKLVGHSHDQVTTNAIAALVHTKAASVTDMIKKLSEKKLVRYTPYQGVALTNTGRRVAAQVVRKHRLWEAFLVQHLGFRWDEVHEVAEQLEHIRSEKLTEQLDRFLGYPKSDPHGDPIPDREGRIHGAGHLPLADFGKKAIVIVTGVSDHSSSFLRYLDHNRIRLGDTIGIKSLNSYDHSMFVSVSKRKAIYISQQVAKNILVRKLRNGK